MSNTFIKLPTGDIELEHIREMYIDLNFTKFEFKDWKPRPALIDKSGQTWLYTGQKYDPNYIELIEDGWSHDHCEICSIPLSENESDINFRSGYFNGGIWVCKTCYEIILSAKDLDKLLIELLKYTK